MNLDFRLPFFLFWIIIIITGINNIVNLLRLKRENCYNVKIIYIVSFFLFRNSFRSRSHYISPDYVDLL